MPLPLLSFLPLVLASPLQLPFLPGQPPLPPSASLSSLALQHATPVRVQLGVMSRCPDAHLCEAVWERVLETRTTVASGNRTVGILARELIQLETVYIGRENSSATYGVTCMHGDLECRGNIQQLCAAHLWNGKEDEKRVGGAEETEKKGRGEEEEGDGVSREKESWEDWWNFIQCINYGETSSIGTDWKAKECAGVVRRDYAPLASCVDSSLGRSLLLHSIRETKELEVSKSCTVLIEGKKVCIHDSTWQSCPDGHSPSEFAKQVGRAWEKLN